MDNGASSYRRFLDGNDEGMYELVRDYKDGLIYFLNSIVGNVHTAEDIAEDVFIKLAIKKPRYNGKASFRTWLYTIGRNLALNHLKRLSRHPEESVEEQAEFASDEEDLYDAVVRKEEYRKLHEAIKKLKPAQAEVLTLHYFEEMSTEEIGQILGKKKHAVEEMLSRARKALKEIMEVDGYEEL